MITAFTVKNFKAIGEEPVRIELKPITLLFGANSAGKSSILHALHYAYEVFNNRNLNAKASTLGGNSLDLGGFERFVHKNDLNRMIVIRVDFDTDYESFRDINSSLFAESDGIKQYFLETSFNLFGITHSYVEVGIAWNQMHKRPYVKYYETGFNGERMATISFDTDKEEAILNYLNIDNPSFCDVWVDHGISMGAIIESSIDPYFYKTNSIYTQESIKINELIEQEKNKIKDKLSNDKAEIKNEDEQYNYNQKINKYIGFIRKQLFEKYGRIPPCTSILASGEDNFNIMLRQRDALPYWNEPLRIDTVWKEYSEEEIAILIGDQPFILPNNRLILKNLLTCILTRPGQYITEIFSMRYLGPLREIPPRHFFSSDPFDELNRGRWATGLAAWDLLYWIGQQQLEGGYWIGWSSSTKIQLAKRKYNIKEAAIQELNIINNWLERLNTGYQIVIEHYREIPSNHPLLEFSTADQSLAKVSELVKNIIDLPEKTRIWLQDDNQNKLTPHEIGVGISQVLPVVVAAAGRNWSSFFVAIEQPELHVHPGIQVQLADLFISHANTKNNINDINDFFLHSKNFLIETHSEHLLLRLLRRINETFEGELAHNTEPCKADDVAIYYLEKKSNQLCVRRLKINEDGTSQGEWPHGFFEERIMELF